jgi:hypothetical protein
VANPSQTRFSITTTNNTNKSKTNPFTTMKPLDIPTSDLNAPFQDSTTTKQLTASRLANAERKRKAAHALDKWFKNEAKTLKEYVAVAQLGRMAPPPPASDGESDSSEQEDASEHNNRHKPKRTSKPKLTAKEKAAARKEKAANKKQRTATRKAVKGEKKRFT